MFLSKRLLMPILAISVGAGCANMHAARQPGGVSPAPASAGPKETSSESRYAVAVTRQVIVPGDGGKVFDFVAAQDVLPKVLTGYGLVPGVVSTSNVSGPWDMPGSHRTVHLADGSTAHEEVTDYARPRYFAYRVSDPTFSLRHLINDASGQWWMESVPGGTRVTWTYTFHAKGPFTRQVLKLFARFQWRGYMDVCLNNVIQHFDMGGAAQAR